MPAIHDPSPSDDPRGAPPGAAGPSSPRPAPALRPRPGADPSPGARLAFVTGRGRSGTWLLQAILNRHPRVRLAPEGELLLLLEGRWGDVVEWTGPLRRRFCRDLRRIPRLTLWWGLDLDVVEERIVERREGADFADMCRLLYHEYARVTGAETVHAVLGEKNPGYALLLPTLFLRFPGARVVHLVRDPRDNVLSFRDVAFDLDGVAALAERWGHYTRAALSAAEAWPERVRIIRFEDLVREPTATVEEACRFLGVEPRSRLLSLQADAGAPVLPWNERIASPPDPGRLERWRSEMCEGDRRAVEARCGTLMDRLGYPRAHPDAGAADRFRTAPGALVGKIATGLERAFARLPFGLQVAVLARYRGWDDRRPLEGDGADPGSPPYSASPGGETA